MKESNDIKNTESVISREIVQHILDFGISQYQILKISYLLSLELENKEKMVDISSTIKKHLDEYSLSATEKSAEIIL